MERLGQVIIIILTILLLITGYFLYECKDNESKKVNVPEYNEKIDSLIRVVYELKGKEQLYTESLNNLRLQRLDLIIANNNIKRKLREYEENLTTVIIFNDSTTLDIFTRYFASQDTSSKNISTHTIEPTN